MAEQDRDVEEPHEERGDLSCRLPHISDPEEKDYKGEQNKGRQDEKDVPLIVEKEDEGDKRSTDGSDHPLHIPFGERHPVELDEPKKGNDQDEAGKEKEIPFENQQDEKRQGDCRRQQSLLNGQLLSDGPPQFSPFGGEPSCPGGYRQFPLCNWSLVRPKRRSRA